MLPPSALNEENGTVVERSQKLRKISEILDSKNPMYARSITDKLIQLPKDQFPPKMVDFFEKIKAGF